MVYIDQKRSSSAVYRYLPFIATIWFFVIIESYLVWGFIAPLMHSIPSILMILGTFMIKKEYSETKKHICIFVSIYIMWVLFTLCDDIPQIVRRLCDFSPILFFIFWPKDLIFKTYIIIRKIVIFYAIGSAVVTVLILLDLNSHLPYFVLPPREALHKNVGIVYNVYGLFVSLCYPVSGVKARACGMLQEPGHFAVVLGSIYMIDRFRKAKENIWIVICGILTFSSIFFFVIIFTEIWNVFSKKNVKKVLLVMALLPALIYFIFISLPSQIQEQVEYLFYGRNLEQVVDAYQEASSLNDALDERASDYSLHTYEKMSTFEYVVGGGNLVPGECLSDYRGMIVYMGIIGMVLSIMSYLMILLKIPLKMKLSLICFYFLIIVHRSFMLFEPYIYLYAFFILILANFDNRKMLLHYGKSNLKIVKK